MLRIDALARLPLIRQRAINECGYACLASILSFFGKRTAISDLNGLYGEAPNGLTLKEIIRVANHEGLITRPMSIELSQLKHVTCPAIIHLNMNHFAVMAAVSSRTAKIMDPKVGYRRVPIDSLSREFSGIVCEFSISPNFNRNNEGKKSPITYAWFARALPQLPRKLLTIGFLTLLLQFMALTSPLYLQLIVDDALASGDRQLIAALAFSFTAILIVRVIMRWVRSLMYMYLDALLKFRANSAVTLGLLSAPNKNIANRDLGDLQSRLSSVDNILNILTATVSDLVFSAISVIVAIIFLISYSPALTLVSVGFTIIYGLIRYFGYSRLRAITSDSLIVGAEANNQLLESLRHHKSIARFGLENVRLSSWAVPYANLLKKGVEGGRLSAYFTIAETLVNGLASIVVLYIGAGLVIEGKLSIGMLVAYSAYRGTFNSGVFAVLNATIKILLGRVHLERVEGLELSGGPTVQERHPVLDSKEQAFSITFDNVGFRYSRVDEFVFDGFTCHIPAGSFVWVKGVSGSGKSTMFSLLLGFHHSSEGRVMVNDYPITEANARSLRQITTGVFHDDVLFQGTVLENVTMFAESPDLRYVRECLESVGMLERVEKLIMRERTPVTDVGARFSSGEQQRLLLARALFRREAKIMYFDEATNYLDQESERRILGHLKKMSSTILFASHRLEVGKHADFTIELTAAALVDGDSVGDREVGE